MDGIIINNLITIYRSRLSYEQFGAFLANIKELNAHKQSREVGHFGPSANIFN